MRVISKISALLFITVVYIFSGTTHVYGQLSPGDLTTAHAELEGISNCTECHTLGEKISSDKCLACHESIKSLVDNGIGYHASSIVKSQDCFACHSEHHGRKFEMIRFDTDAFDHSLTGYTLFGAHTSLECNECHKQDFRVDNTLSKRIDTYLGLTPREFEVCNMVNGGLNTKEIARILNLSIRTVETHRLNIRKKLPAGKFEKP